MMTVSIMMRVSVIWRRWLAGSSLAGVAEHFSIRSMAHAVPVTKLGFPCFVLVKKQRQILRSAQDDSIQCNRGDGVPGALSLG